MVSGQGQDEVRLVPNGGWDERVVIVRCAPTVDSFIVVTERYVVLIDTLLGPGTAGALLTFAREWLREGRTLLVINTHADWDHCWGNQLFAGPVAVAPAPIIATRACGARFAGGEVGKKLTAMQVSEPGRFEGVLPVGPTVLFDEQLAIDGGDLTLELFLAPGHREDHVAVFIPKIATLLAGDAAESPFPFAASAEALPQLRATLEELAARDAQVTLYCHAPETSGPRLIRENIAYFDRLEAHCRAALARGVPSQPTPDADLERLVGFRFEDAVPAGLDPSGLAEMYRSGHRTHLRMMLEWLGNL